MQIIIDRQASLPLTKQIYQQLCQAVLHGSLHSGDRLPSSRQLAAELSVSRMIILEVYEQLQAEGYITAKRGSGTVVASGIANIPPVRQAAATERQVPALPPCIDFHSGQPDSALFPKRLWGKLYKDFCCQAHPAAFSYATSAGTPELASAIASYLSRSRGIRCRSEQIIITSGSTQGLSLISRLLFIPGSAALVEEPSHPGILNVIKGHGYTLIPNKVDSHGLITSALPADCRPAIIYTTPSHQFPLGGILPIQRRLQLLSYARQHGSYILEDDYDNEFRYTGAPVSSMYELEPDRVIYLSSFSKILSPALRLGFIIVPSPLLSRFKKLKTYTDVHSEAISQYVLAGFINSGALERHIWQCRKIYARKRQLLINVLQRCCQHKFQLRGIAAGLHLVVYFPEVHFTLSLIKKIRLNGVRIYPLSGYGITPQPEYSQQILLGYAHLTQQEITVGIQKLCQLINESSPA